MLTVVLSFALPRLLLEREVDRYAVRTSQQVVIQISTVVNRQPLVALTKVTQKGLNCHHYNCIKQIVRQDET